MGPAPRPCPWPLALGRWLSGRLGLARWLLLGAAVHSVAAASPSYNVLFVAVDDLRPELGCYGHRVVRSPHLDRLASQGLRFDRAYCQEALCNPSRASLLTGLRPATLGIYDLATHVRDRRPEVVTLPQLFKRNGYRSVSMGKIFHVTNGNRDDLESWSEAPWRGPKSEAQPDEAQPGEAPVAPGAPEPRRARPARPVAADHSNTLPFSAPDCADEALLDGKIAAQAVARLGQLKDRPFFLAVGFHKPHLPMVAPKKYWDLYPTNALRLAANPFLPKDAPAFASNDASELRRYKGIPAEGPIADEVALGVIHAYYACVSYIDAQVGRLLAELDRLGLSEKTIVVVWGDHGYHLGEHGTWTKRTNWEVATRVPLLVRVPGQKAPGSATQALVEFVDLYPTLAELCGLTPPGDLEGTSFVPLLADPGRPWKTAAFSVYPKTIPGVGKGFGQAMRTERYRLIEWAAEGQSARHYELYDHRTDPEENVNLAGHPEQREVLGGLVARLRAGWTAARPPPAPAP